MTPKQKALSLVGQGYIYGAKGQVCSRVFREGQAAQYPDQADNILRVGEKWDGVPVWDCAQLTRAVAKEGGVTLVSGATSQWSKTDWQERGEIGRIPDGVLCFVYRGNGNVMQHTGVALGDGTCVHARGTAYGVVRQRMEEYHWTHWAMPKWPGESERNAERGWKAMEKGVFEPYMAFAHAESGSSVNLREGPGTDTDIAERMPIGSVVSVQELLGDWARVISCSGKEGYVMARFLRRADAGQRVQVEIDADAAKKLLEALKRAIG